ncbi:MAG: DotU family type IV/VI secretion system protein [Gammaproteobacteria bacterium]|nr:DotU family type IV/VI secretion system protein [Gammaproteobacteria bacterium]
MIATPNQQAPKENLVTVLPTEADFEAKRFDTVPSPLKTLSAPSQSLLISRTFNHHPSAGLNPLVDAANYFFSITGKLKQLKSYRKLNKLQNELMQEINSFQETAQSHGYNSEYTIVCRYLLCATFDDVIANTPWGGQDQWEPYSLLAAFKQHTYHQDKFFNILERAVKEPAIYIDMMELIYICLSMGYKGQYRATEHSQYQLEQITNNLYKHIRAYRGSFSKALSPTPLKTKSVSKVAEKRNTHPLFILFVSACVVMAIFISLGYLMDVISNEAFKNIKQIQTPVSTETSKL